MKQVKIHVSRNFTLNRKGAEPVELTAGVNVVDADVADHPFVKHHTVDGTATVNADADLLALVDANEKEIASLKSQLEKSKDGKAVAALEKEVAELKAVIAAYEATKPAK